MTDKPKKKEIPNFNFSEKMKDKKLSSKTNFSIFLQLNCHNFRFNYVKHLIDNKIVKQIKFAEAHSELETKTCLL